MTARSKQSGQFSKHWYFRLIKLRIRIRSANDRHLGPRSTAVAKQNVHSARANDVTQLKVASVYGVRIDTIDYIKNGMSDNSSTGESYRWCRPVAGESQNEFGRQETEIFPEVVKSESDIFTF